MLAASPRTGSSWLATMLASAGVAGRPREYAREMDRNVWRDMLGYSSHLAYFWSLPSLCTTDNGVLGLKLIFAQAEPLADDVRRYTAVRSDSVLGALAGWLGEPRYVWLRRRDRVRQAISFVRALQTDTWASTASGNGVVPRYDHAAVDEAARYLGAADDGWAEYFRSEGVEPLVVWYEDLAGDPATVMAAIADFVGFDLATGWSSELERQADDVSEAWLRAHRRERGR